MGNDNTNHSPDPTRQKLLDAAVVVFAQHGLDGASVRSICDAAGVKNIGAINYYFQSKENLYAEAVNHALSQGDLGKRMESMPRDLPPAEQLRQFIHGMIRHHMEVRNPREMELVMREFSQPTAACAPAVEANIRPMAVQLHRILSELRPALTFDQRLLICFSIIGQCLYYVQNQHVTKILFGPDVFQRFTTHQIAEHITDLTLRGMGIPTRPAKGDRS